MKSKGLTIAVLIALGSMPAMPSFAQGTKQTLMRLDVSVVASGYRASKIIGASILNDGNQKIGSVDDLIVTRNESVPYAIVSVGGFLGVGDKLVAVPMESLHISPERIVFPGATKEMLKNLPEFKYAK